MAAPTAVEVFARQHLAVFRFLRRMTGSGTAAEDLAQEVFLRVVRGLERYEDRTQERAWVFRIARNLLMDERRRLDRSPILADPHGNGFEPARPATQELEAWLRHALDALPEDERAAFLMREVGGLGYEEISQAMECTKDAVRMRIYRARLALREALPAPKGPPHTVAKGASQ